MAGSTLPVTEKPAPAGPSLHPAFYIAYVSRPYRSVSGLSFAD